MFNADSLRRIATHVNMPIMRRMYELKESAQRGRYSHVVQFDCAMSKEDKKYLVDNKFTIRAFKNNGNYKYRYTISW